MPRILWAVRLAAETSALLPAEAPTGWRLPEPGELDGVENVHPHMTFNPPWTPDLMSEDAKFALGY